ncbi:cyclin-A1 isoform X2 [Theropithecus gelada]|uniref:cyclin-A1 isoform X2 n=1 Tax=Theropithecus gelada TaxID=9565 RepID=UPI000DC17E58|nr:cyclin-A1 isoform X2 [Theropithecus gelada]
METPHCRDCTWGHPAASRPPPGRKRRCVSRPRARRALGPAWAGRRSLRSPEGPASLSRARVLRSGSRRRRYRGVVSGCWENGSQKQSLPKPGPSWGGRVRPPRPGARTRGYVCRLRPPAPPGPGGDAQLELEGRRPLVPQGPERPGVAARPPGATQQRVESEAMHCSNPKNGVVLATVARGPRGPDACQILTRAPLGQDPPQRTVLGLLTENGQYRRTCGQGITRIRCYSGSENAFPPAGKKALPDCGVQEPPKQGFDIYMDELEQRDGDSCSGREGMAFEDVYEVDTSTLKSDLHFLLDFNTVSPMLVDSSLLSQSEEISSLGTDVTNVTEYAEEIYQYLREAEIRHRPKAHYMKKQPDITEDMRTILVDWLVEVGEEYKLRAETLYLAVNFLDRFLSCMSVLRGKLQLVGTAAILLASKYEEIYPPEVDEFVYITDDTYTKRQLLKMEHLLLKVLAFDLTVPTTNQFLLQYLRRQGVCVRTENLAKYVAELSLLEADPFLKYLPSLIAAAAFCLANYTVNKHFWPETLAAFTGYSLSEIVPCLSELHKAYLDIPHRPQQAIREKYKASKYLRVSLMEPPSVLLLQ